MTKKRNEGQQDSFLEIPELTRRELLILLGLSATAGGTPKALFAAAPLGEAEAGKRIPELTATVNQSVPWMTDLIRKVALDGEKIGLKYKINMVHSSAWNNAMFQHTYGDLSIHQHLSEDFRDADPTDTMVSRVHSREAPAPKRNFCEYKNPEIDKWAEVIETELDPKKRLQAAYMVQEIAARDYTYWSPCTGPNPISAYNSAEWEGVVVSPGAGIAGWKYIWNWMSIRPKGNRKRVIWATNRLDTLQATNPFGPSGVGGMPNQLYYDKLLMFSPETKVVPWVVTAWKMVDKMTWDLTIRSGMKWHDGRPATVEDVAFTFNYMAKWKPSGYSTVWGTVTEARVMDQRTVRLKTNRQAANMASEILIRTALMPKHIWENLAESQNVTDLAGVKLPREKIIGTGPFKFVHFTPDVECLVTANKDHWQAPKFDELLCILVPNLDTILGRLENKEVDFVDQFLMPSQANRLKGIPHISVVEGFRTTNPFFFLMMERMPWRDPVFRKAWHRTVDKNYLVNVIWEGSGDVMPFNSLLGRRHPFHNPNVSTRFNYSLDEAREILRAGGYSWDKEGRLMYPGPENTDFKKRAQRVIV